jgi:hypothetical protein
VTGTNSATTIFRFTGGYIWLDPPSNRIYFCDDPTCDCLGSDIKGHRGICTGIKWPDPPRTSTVSFQ